MSTPATGGRAEALRRRFQAPKLPRPRLPRRERDALSPDEQVAWSTLDKAGLAAAWFCGLLLCAIAASIVLYMLVRGLQYLSVSALFEHPVILSTTQSTGTAGGYLDPIEGTLILTTLGTLIALPIGVGTAVWLSEYGRPHWLARAVESGVEIVAGTPTIVLAIFGLLVFTQGALGFLSFTAEGGAVFGRSFFIAGIMMSLIAIPLIVGATREALQSIPAHVREASYALGKDKISTIRRVLLPASRKGIATGTTLGMGRIAGDTAIVVILLGATPLEPQGDVPVLRVLQGTGSTLTSYVYNNSPAGEGNAPEKAYAAAFVLLVIVILMNFFVDLISRQGSDPWAR
ncbi:MAG TPA: ABC transporter permease subunit [Solirubrobacterales bacterium]|jgi:phosphate transport system permease protein